MLLVVPRPLQSAITQLVRNFHGLLRPRLPITALRFCKAKIDCRRLHGALDFCAISRDEAGAKLCRHLVSRYPVEVTASVGFFLCTDHDALLSIGRFVGNSSLTSCFKRAQISDSIASLRLRPARTFWTALALYPISDANSETVDLVTARYTLKSADTAVWSVMIAPITTSIVSNDRIGSTRESR